MIRVRPGIPVAAAAAVLALLAGARALPAQQATATVRGVVTDTAGTPVPYALVRILRATSEQFTGALGRFAAAGLVPGTYRIQVRQVGFEPFDSTVSVSSSAAVLRVVLRPLSIRLDELTISTAGRCTVPGPPDPLASPELATIFAQLSENARRFVVLADSYPFRYFIERTFDDVTDEGKIVWTETDTVEYRSDSRGRYRPGNVLEPGIDARGRRERTVRLPTLPDLADSAFHANHCFAFGGVGTQDGGRVLRVLFRAAERLSGPDIDGEADLDAETYQLRLLTFRLTRPQRALRGLDSLSGTMALVALHPNLAVPGTIRSTQVSRPTTAIPPLRPITRHLELQRLIRVHFLRPLPTDSTPSP